MGINHTLKLFLSHQGNSLTENVWMKIECILAAVKKYIFLCTSCKSLEGSSHLAILMCYVTKSYHSLVFWLLADTQIEMEYLFASYYA